MSVGEGVRVWASVCVGKGVWARACECGRGCVGE